MTQIQHKVNRFLRYMPHLITLNTLEELRVKSIYVSFYMSFFEQEPPSAVGLRPTNKKKRSKLLHFVPQFSQLINAALFVPQSLPINKSTGNVRDKKVWQAQT